VLCWTGPVVHRIYVLATNQTTPESPETPTRLQLWDACGTSIQGFANAMVWLTNPSFFTAIRKQVLDKYFGRCLTPAGDEQHPILSGIQDTLGDSRQDINRIGEKLRRNIITCILLGVQQSLTAVMSKNEHVTEKEYSKTHTYNWADLLDDATSGQAQAFEFIDYAPIVFSDIRSLSNISAESYKASMSPANFLGKLSDQLAKFSDGRSNSFFIFSPDKKFIIKTISDQEAKVLLEMLPRLHEYFKANHHSLITRFYGCHGVRVSHGEQVHAVVMGNVFSAPLAIHECYDLKGSWVNRSAGKSRTDPSKLGMDLDLRRLLKLDPSYKEMFLQQIRKDSLLLCSMNIMDYSLLLGFHFLDRANASSSSASYPSSNSNIPAPPTRPPGIELTQFVSPSETTNHTLDTLPGSHGLMQLMSSDRTELYCVGIIDVLQQYDRHKQVERIMKVYFLQKDGTGLSSMPPRPYADRFEDKMKTIVM